MVSLVFLKSSSRLSQILLFQLQDAGIEARHAEAIALAVKQGQGDLATKQDITLLKQDIDQLKTELGTKIAWIK